MKPLLIIKTGSAFASLQSEFGDFDDFVLNQMPGIGNVLVATVFKRIWLPAYDTVSGVIITGSHAMVTDREDWSEFVAKWLRGIAANTLPVLGICYGHQLLAHAWGGDVGYHPQGKEIGTVGIDLTAAGCKDPLLSCMPRSFIGHVTHAQTVLRLPAGATVLAHNEHEPHQAFVINGNQWGVQFHPEFNAIIERTYIEEQKNELILAGRNLPAIEASVQEHPYGQQLFQRFAALAGIIPQPS